MMKFPKSVYDAPVVILVGMPMSGKTKLGKSLAKEKKCLFIDTDQEIEKSQNLTIPQIFNQYGEDYFRQLEYQWIVNFKISQPAVIATGGGMPCWGENMMLLRNVGLTVYIDIPLKMLINRVKLSEKRPLFEGKSENELIEFVTEMYQKRHPIYSQSHEVIDFNFSDNIP